VKARVAAEWKKQWIQLKLPASHRQAIGHASAVKSRCDGVGEGVKAIVT
jgi:hypothetical protein